MTTILQAPLLIDFIYPFLLIFFIVFAILEKSKLFGDEKKQLNALVALVIGLIFISAFHPKEIVTNLMLFLSVALVIMFVVLLLWGFVFADTKGEKGFELTNGMKIGLGIVVGIAVVVAVLWAAGVTGLSDFLFKQTWSNTFWTNFIFIVLIGFAVGIVIQSSGKKD